MDNTISNFKPVGVKYTTAMRFYVGIFIIFYKNSTPTIRFVCLIENEYPHGEICPTCYTKH
ncbi:MAG: hypothetical protein OHK0057_37460 [Thermoflexibacter sp.]